MSGSSRLFHAVVVLGAALAGCGGRADRPGLVHIGVDPTNVLRELGGAGVSA